MRTRDKAWKVMAKNGSIVVFGLNNLTWINSRKCRLPLKVNFGMNNVTSRNDSEVRLTSSYGNMKCRLIYNLSKMRSVIYIIKSKLRFLHHWYELADKIVKFRNFVLCRENLFTLTMKNYGYNVYHYNNGVKIEISFTLYILLLFTKLR